MSAHVHIIDITIEADTHDLDGILQQLEERLRSAIALPARRKDGSPADTLPAQEEEPRTGEEEEQVPPERENQGDECNHDWRIETPNGPTSKGECRICHETREFTNSPEAATEQRRRPGGGGGGCPCWPARRQPRCRCPPPPQVRIRPLQTLWSWHEDRVPSEALPK